jgi:hypothetical protein
VTVSEGPIPRNFNEAAPALLWGVFAFASGFEGVVMLFEAHFILGIVGILAAVALTAIAMRWQRISAVWPRFGETFNSIASDARWWVASLLTLLVAAAALPYVEQGRWPYFQTGTTAPTVIHDPASPEDVAKATSSIQFRLDEATRQRDTSIAERDSARRELASARQELEAARRAEHVPAQQMQANISDGPLRWEPNLMWGATGTPHGLLMSFVYFRATNVSPNAVQLKNAFIVSGLTGAKLPLSVNIAYVGVTPISEINPIPPGASVDLIVEWKEPDALSVKEFLNQWGSIYLRVDYDQTIYERTYDSDYLYQKATREYPQEGFGPRVTKREQK